MRKQQQQNFPGFTLIELLVVLVIVGILTVFALPQFIFAVERSRVSSVLTTINTLRDALDEQILMGLNERHLDYVGGDEIGRNLLLTNVDCELSGEDELDERCYAGKFSFRVWCSELGCFVSVVRGPWSGDDYGLLLRKVLTDWNDYPIGVWDKDCMAHSDLGYKICQSLSKEGWKLSDERYKEFH